MKTLYIECGMGAAGDMLMAALCELLPNPDSFVDKMNAIFPEAVRISRKTDRVCGICGTHLSVTVNGQEEISHDVSCHGHRHEHSHEHPHEHPHEHSHEHPHEHPHEHSHEHPHEHSHEHPYEHSHDAHSHASLADMEHIVSGLAVSDKVKTDAMAVYRLIAEAESHAHGKPVAEIHFHEVGTMDAVADIIGVCLLMEELAPDRVMVSPIHVGKGYVKCMHGILPVPAPATAYLLRGVPIYSGSVEGELCTPTGAALLTYFADAFGDMPVMKPTAIGYGIGSKKFDIANCVRTFIGESEDKSEQILELTCNLDDMTPEDIGFATERLLAAGALDVFTAPIGMKKNRPAVLLTCLCRPEEREIMLHEMFLHTLTLGVRETVCRRYRLDRNETVCQTPYGDVRVKRAFGYGVIRSKPEYDDVARLARDNSVSMEAVRKELS